MLRFSKGTSTRTRREPRRRPTLRLARAACHAGRKTKHGDRRHRATIPLKSTAGAELLNLTAHAEQPSAASSTSHTNPPRAERPPNDTSPVRPRKRPPSVGPAGPDASQSTLVEIRQSVTLENRDDRAIAYRLRHRDGHPTNDGRGCRRHWSGESRNPRGDRSRAGPPAGGHENRHLRRRAPRRTDRDQPHDQDREPRHMDRGHHRSRGQPGTDRPDWCSKRST